MTEKSTERVRRHRDTERLHRESIDAAFRTQLAQELGARALTISEVALVDCASSAYLQLTVETSRFLRGRSGETGQERLAIARSTLIRCLRSLGLPRKPAAPQPPTIEDLLAPYRDKPADDKEANDEHDPVRPE